MIHELFATPILHTTLRDDLQRSIQHEIGSIISNMKFDKISEFGSHSHSLSVDRTFKQNIIEEYNLETFRSVIKEIASDYLIYLRGVEQYEITFRDSWLTKTCKGEHANVHSHIGADISGVYYYQTNSQDGNIRFVNPNPILDYCKIFPTKLTGDFIPAVGNIILFPSWLMHFVSENETDSERISLAFNLNVNWN